MSAVDNGPVATAPRPLVLLCECAGTMANIDFDALAERTLGKRWGELKPAERTRYVAAMRSAMGISSFSAAFLA